MSAAIFLASIPPVAAQQETRSLVFSTNGVSLTEAAGPTHAAKYTVALASQPTASVTVSLSSGDEDAATVSPAKLTFTTGNWQNGQTVTVTAVDDNVQNSHLSIGKFIYFRQFAITHTARGGGYDSITGSVTVDVYDNDFNPTFSIADAQVSEGDSGEVDLNFTVTLSPATVDRTLVRYSTANGSATAGEDYTGVNANETSLLFKPGESSKTVTIKVKGDVIDENNETLTVTLSGQGRNSHNTPKDIKIGTATATGTITDDDDAPSGITLVASPDWVTEDGGAKTVTVTASVNGTTRYADAKTVAVTVGKSGDSATEGTDYTTVADLSIEIAAGAASASKSFTLTPTNDALDESDETISVEGASPGVTVTADQIIITTPGLVFSKTGVGLTEAAGPKHTGTYTVALAGQPTASVTVNLSSGDESAATVSPAKLTFTTDNWQDGQTVTVTAVDDNVQNSELNTAIGRYFRQFPISHTARGGGYDSITGSVTVDVFDNDFNPTFSIADAQVSEGDSGEVNLNFTVTLSPATITRTVVRYSTANGSATAGEDYTGVNAKDTSLRFEPGDSSKTVTIKVKGDVIDENNETLTMTLSEQGRIGHNTPKDIKIGTATATGTITDDDDAPSGITLVASPDSVTEDGGAKTVTVTASVNGTTRYADAKTVAVTVGKSGDSATEGTDYSNVSGLSIEIAAGAASGSKNFTLTPTNDALDESDETISVEGTSSGVTVTAEEITITDDDEKGIVLSKSAVTVTEASGSGRTENYTVKLASQPTADVTVAVSSGDTSSATVNKASLSFSTSDWNTAQTVTVTGKDDTIDNPQDRTATVSHSASGGDYGSVSKDLTVTVADDEATGITLVVSPDSVTENGGATSMKLTASVNGSTRYDEAKTVTVTVGRSADSATEGTDYATVSDFSIKVPARAASVSRVFALTPINDAIDEGTGETISVAGTSSVPVTADQITITDDDTRGVALSKEALTLTEGGAHKTYTLKLLSQPTEEVTINVSGAPSGLVNFQYQNTNSSSAPIPVTFDENDWNRPKTITVVAISDDDHEDNSGSIVHTVEGYGDFTAADSISVTVTDTSVPAVLFNTIQVSLKEGETVTYTVKLATRPSGTVTVTPISDDTGIATVSGPLSLNSTNWISGLTVTVTGAQDENAVTDTTSVSHTVAGYHDDVTRAGPVSVTVTDDDAALVLTDSLNTLISKDTNLFVWEGLPVTSHQKYKIRLAAQPGGTVTVTPVSQDRTSVSVSGPLTFNKNNWATDQIVELTGVIDEDGIGERVKIDHTVSGYDAEPVSVNTIVRDYHGHTLVVEPRTLGIHEGMTGTYSVKLRTDPKSTVTVTPGVENDSAASVSGALTFNSSNWSIPQNVTVTAKTDEDRGRKYVTITNEVSGYPSYRKIHPGGFYRWGNDNPDVSTVALTTVDPRPGLALLGCCIYVGEGATVTTAIIRLATEPLDTVTVSLASSDENIVKVSPATLEFTAKNWNVYQAITVTGEEDDIINENPRQTEILLTTTGDYADADGDIDVFVSDNDGIALSVTPASVAESDGSTRVSVTATLPGDATLDKDTTITVKVGDSADVATEGTDYSTVEDFTLRIPKGTNSAGQNFNMVPTQDAIDEGEGETLSISGTTAASGLSVSSTQMTITDDDATPTVTLALSKSSISENGGETLVTAELSALSSVEVTVRVSAAAVGPAVSGDFTLSQNKTLTIAAGSKTSTGTVTIRAVDNTTDAADKQVTVSGSASGGHGVANPASKTLTITDDDGEIALEASRTSVAEWNGATEVTVTATLPDSLTRSSATEVTVKVGEKGTATEGIDYATVADFTLTIAAGQRSGTAKFNIDPTQDAIDEPNETVGITGATSVLGLTVGETSIFIADDDVPPSGAIALAASPVSVAESADATEVTVTATLPGSTTRSTATAVTVKVGEKGTATEGTDYATVADFTLTIAAGQRSGTAKFNINPTQDTTDEGTGETVGITGATSVSGFTVGETSITITDDDGEIALSASPASVAESADATEVTVTATLPGSTTRSTATAVTVKVGEKGTATEGTDYATVADFTLTIAAGQRSGTAKFIINPTQDVIDEDTGETVGITGTTTVSGLTVGETSMTITDDDATPTVTLALSKSSIPENGGSTTVTATLSGVSSAATTVTVSAAAVSPAVSGDYTLSENKTLTIAAGATASTGTVTITAVNNTVDAPNKTVTVSGDASGGHGAADPANQTLTITDDEGTPTLTLKLSKSTISESGGTATVTAALSGVSSAATTVTVSAAAVSPAVSGDFTVSTNKTLTIAAGATASTGTVIISAVDNPTDAADKQVTVSGAASGGRGVADPTDQTLTIADDDGAIALSAEPASVAESAGATEVTVTARLPGAARSAATTVTVKVGDSGDAATEGTDYATVDDFTLTIASGATSGTAKFNIDPTQDAIDEGTGETLSISGTTDASGLSVSATQMTITDDDATPTVTLALSKSSIPENGGSTTVTATLSGVSSAATTVTVSAAPVSPAVSGDFTLSENKTLTIAAGATASTGTVTISAVNNTVDAPNKTVTVSGDASGGHGAADPANKTLTITDDDAAPSGITLVASPDSVTENGGAKTVTVTASVNGTTRYAAAKDGCGDGRQERRQRHRGHRLLDGGQSEHFDCGGRRQRLEGVHADADQR